MTSLRRPCGKPPSPLVAVRGAWDGGMARELRAVLLWGRGLQATLRAPTLAGVRRGERGARAQRQRLRPCALLTGGRPHSTGAATLGRGQGSAVASRETNRRHPQHGLVSPWRS